MIPTAAKETSTFDQAPSLVELCIGLPKYAQRDCYIPFFLFVLKKILYFKRRIKMPSSRFLHFHIRPCYVNLLCIIVRLCAAWFHIYIYILTSRDVYMQRARPMSLRVRKFTSKEKRGSHIVILKTLIPKRTQVLRPLLKFVQI